LRRQRARASIGSAERSFGEIQIKENVMPRGDKSAYTDKQKRQARHIEEGYEEKGVSKKRAERIAYSTVNKQDGGGKKSGSGRAASSGSRTHH
jgi:plasmid stabilization system protein ParE